MKIINVIGSCGAGGAEILVKDLLIEMKEQGADVGLWIMTRVKDMAGAEKVNLDFENTFLDELELFSIPYDFVNKRPNKDWLKTTWRLNQLYNKCRPSIIHSHLESVSFHVARSLFFRRASLFQTIHNTRIENSLVAKYLFPRAFKGFVAISELVNDVAKQGGLPNNKIYIILNGVNIDRFVNEGRSIHQRVKSIISIGRLTKQKNFENLISAIAILKAKLNGSGIELPKVYIAGDGELRDQLQTLINENKLENDMQLLGIQKDIPALLGKNDIYVMSSEWEGLSISLIEALASGIPVVATDAGSNREIIDHEKNGIIVPVKDPQALANGIFRLLNDRELRSRFSKAAAEKASVFSISECASRHLDLYNTIKP